MTMHPLEQRISKLKRRAFLVYGTIGAGRGVLAALVVLIVGAWIDLAFDLPALMRVLIGVAIVVIAIIPTWLAIRTGTTTATPAGLSRVLDRVAESSGEIHAGLDLLLHPAPATAGGNVTASLRSLAVKRASSLAMSIPPSFVVPARPVMRVLLFVVAMLAGVGIFSLIAPRITSTEWLRFSDPFGDHPPYSPLTFTVEPGNSKVLYGGDLPIKVHVDGGTPERLDLIVLSDDLRSSDSLPMFPGDANTWQATITTVTTPAWYSVQSGHARSARFRLDLITVPKIEQARVRITPPAYTNLPPYDGAIPPAGIAGLPGTKVDLTLKSNRPLSRGDIQFTSDSQITAVLLKPASPNSAEVTGSFMLSAAGRLNASVTDIAGQNSVVPMSANLVVTADERPFVRILQPLAKSFATPNVDLAIEISAEDDYGISRLQLFRAINDSRSLPQEIAVPKPPATRFPSTTVLPLSAYGLKPGDVIKLFAHVEDTNPEGPGASDSTVVVVTIISEEQMQKMVLARQSMETLQSKYEQANRRMESISKQLEDLQKELPAEDMPLTDEQKKKIEELAANIENESKAIREAEKQDLPFDLDKALRTDLEKVAETLDKAHDDTKAISDQASMMTTAGAKRNLADALKKMQGEHEEFDQSVTEPLQRLAEVFALREDQAKFEQLYDQERDLEVRLNSLRDKNGQDNPELKNRMRDMEDEQRNLRQDLQRLLDDIDSNVAKLPDDKSLDDLRTSSQAFSKAVRESTIVEEMASGEAGLAGFSGRLGHDGAKVAADLMESMLSKCQGMGEKASSSLKFQPRLAQDIGNTVEQLLEAEGLGTKEGNGKGGKGGYSMSRNSLQNVGLYGRLPDRAQLAKLGGQGNNSGKTDGWGKNNKPGATDLVDAHGRQRASGGSDASVPPQYRRQVGDYFKRVADDLGDQK